MALAAAAVSGVASGPYVLVVDDHEPCLDLMRAVLETSGHRCEIARTAADALVHSDRQPPRAVITDLQMPDLDGEILGRWLKARYPGIPLVLITADELDAAERARIADCFAFVLQKPFDPARLLACLDHLLTPDAPTSEFGLP